VFVFGLFLDKLVEVIVRILLNNSMPILTIGIPIFNGEKIIRKRLELIISQFFNDFLLWEGVSNLDFI